MWKNGKSEWQEFFQRAQWGRTGKKVQQTSRRSFLHNSVNRRARIQRSDQFSFWLDDWSGIATGKNKLFWDWALAWDPHELDCSERASQKLSVKLLLAKFGARLKHGFWSRVNPEHFKQKLWACSRKDHTVPTVHRMLWVSCDRAWIRGQKSQKNCGLWHKRSTYLRRGSETLCEPENFFQDQKQLPSELQTDVW